MNIKRSVKVIFALIMLVLIGSGCAIFPRYLLAPKMNPQGKSLAEFEDQVQKLIAFRTPPGLMVSVVKNGKKVYQKGFGSGLSDSMTGDKVFHWWSVTKIFTSISVLQLSEKGLIDLDRPITDYLPEFSFAIDSSLASQPKVTVRDVLSHRSGLGDAMPEMMFWIHYSPADHKSQTQLLKEIWPKYNKLVYTIGTEARYTNLGYLLLGVLIEKASGIAYEDYVSQNILAPLEMNSSGFSYSESMRSRMIHGSHPYDLMGIMASFNMDMKKAVHERKNFTWWFNEVYTDYTPPSGLLSSVEDMTRFVSAYLSQEDSSLLSPSLRKEMMRPLIDVKESPAPIDGLKFGLGWFVMDLDEQSSRTAVVHGGNGISQSAFVGLVPKENLGIVIVSNSTYMGKDMGLSVFKMLAEVDWERER